MRIMTATTHKKDQPITRGILESELGILESKLKKGLDKALDKTFVEERQRNIVFFASKQDLKDGLENLKQDLKTDINKNQTYLEKIVAKLEKKEQENLIHNHQHKLAEDRLANHDKRIEKLEKAVAV